MIDVLKIVFDTCFFYTLSGFYLYLVILDHALPAGLPILAVSIIIYILIRSKFGNETKPIVKIICCALPAAFFIFRPSIGQIVQFLPSWAYVSAAIWLNRTSTTKRDFHDHFSTTGRFLLLMAPGFVVYHRCASAFTGIIIYLICYLLLGIALLRILREEGKLSKWRTVGMLAPLLPASFLFVILRAPESIMTVIGFIYKQIIIRLFTYAVYAVGAIAYGIYWLLSLLFSGVEKTDKELELNADLSAESIFGETGPIKELSIPRWAVVAAIVLVCLIAAGIVFLILRRLLGRRPGTLKEALYTEEKSSLTARPSKKDRKLFRPRDPVQAVRWYYRKYLREGIKRGAYIKPVDTSADALGKCRTIFDGGLQESLRVVYVEARYSSSPQTGGRDADAAASIWKRLKESEEPQ